MGFVLATTGSTYKQMEERHMSLFQWFFFRKAIWLHRWLVSRNVAEELSDTDLSNHDCVWRKFNWIISHHSQLWRNNLDVLEAGIDAHEDVRTPAHQHHPQRQTGVELQCQSIHTWIHTKDTASSINLRVLFKSLWFASTQKDCLFGKS